MERFILSFKNRFSDECLFRTKSIVNKHNTRIWGSDSLQAVEQVSMSNENIMLWCAMHKTKILGPYFFRPSPVYSATYK